MRKKAILTLVTALAVLVLVPLSISAGSQGESAAAEETLTITWEGRISSGEESTYAMDVIQEKFNVIIEPNGLGANDGAEKVDLMIATGDFPDVGNYWVDKWDLWDDGIIRSFPYDMIRKYMPNYTKYFDEYVPLGWLLNRDPDDDSKTITILGHAPATEVCTWAIGFRKDWAEKVGWAIPADYEATKWSTDNVERTYYYDGEITMDEWVDLLKKLKTGDPDGNGKDDTIPLTGSGTWWTWSSFTGAFELNRRDAGNWLENGKLVEWRISENFKNFLKWANMLWANGLIDKEYATQDLRKAWEKTGGNHPAAMMVAQVGYAFRDDDNLNRPPVNLATLDDVAAGAEILLSPGPTGATGHRGESVYRQVSSALGYQVYIGSQVDDNKLARIMQIIDWGFYGDDEAYITRSRGEAGVHFDWVGEPYNSQAKGRKLEDVPEGNWKTGGWFTGYPPVTPFDKFKMVYTPKYVEHLDYLYSEKGAAIAMRTYKQDVFNETNQVAVMKQYGETLQTMSEEFETRAIIGDIDIDAEWGSYVSKWLAAGGDEYLAEVNKCPIIEELLKGNRTYSDDY